MRHRSTLLPMSALLAVCAAALGGCDSGDSSKAAQAPPPPPAVTVSRPVQKVVSDFSDFVGRFIAVDDVEVRSRVSGYLEKIHFTDGQLVTAGETLITIDRRPFEAALAQAQAALAQAEANRSFAASDLERGKDLVRGTTITQQTYDQRVQAKRVADAAVQAQQAAVKQAQLDLDFTELKAPISGRIGDRRVSLGNLVTGGTNGNTSLLATIVSLDPIRFEFTIDEASYLNYLKVNSKDGAEGLSQAPPVPVKLKLIDEDDFVHEGQINFVDNAIDESSGTIRLRAEFDNKGGKLTPGMFGRVRLPTSVPAMALLVPDAAIGTEQVRKFVYTVGHDNVVNPKFVTLGPVIDGMRVVKAGLEADDTIVVNGLMRVRPGVKVTPQQATADAVPVNQAANKIDR